jgi:hypothetical protein
MQEVEDLLKDDLLCCPEDHYCKNDCKETKMLCEECHIPICRSCQKQLCAHQKIIRGLANDNWWGYVQDWIFEQEVTWMEKTVSTPFWTGLTIFTIGAKGQERKGRRQHLINQTTYASEVGKNNV